MDVSGGGFCDKERMLGRKCKKGQVGAKIEIKKDGENIKNEKEKMNRGESSLRNRISSSPNNFEN